MKLAFSLIFLSYFLISVSFGQSESKVIICDPISARQNNFSLSYCKPNPSFFLTIDSVLTLKFDTTSNYFYQTVNFEDSASVLRLQFDNLGSFIEFRGLYSSNLDTLNISKFKTYLNCLPDSEVTVITHYQVYVDTVEILKPIKSTVKRKETKNCPVRDIRPFSLTLNSVTISVPLEITRKQSLNVLDFHTYSKRNVMRKYKNKNYKYFYGSTVTKEFILIGYVMVK